MAAGGASPPAPQVLLGLRDAAVSPAGSCQGGFLQLHGAASKLGGSADCAPSVTLVHPACGICKAGLAHIVQIYCPLEGSPFHRIINVFACTMKNCWGNSKSWKVLRSQYLQVQGKEMQDCKWKQKQECRPAAKDWCEEADDWGEGDEAAASEYTTGHSRDLLTVSDSLLREGDCATQFQGLSLEEPPSASHSLNSHHPPGGEQIMPSCVPEFQPYYISVVEEDDFLCYEDTGHAQRLLKEYQQREGLDLEQLMLESHREAPLIMEQPFPVRCSPDILDCNTHQLQPSRMYDVGADWSCNPKHLEGNSYASDGCGEKYEKSEAEKRHQVFLKFMKKISLCPEQILRYSWGGQPLFITCPSTDIGSAAPPCNICQSKRIFEFQLMPTLVSMLKTRDDDVSVEFGTALVYTCEKSCWPANQPTALEEFIFVQEDPDQKLFK